MDTSTQGTQLADVAGFPSNFERSLQYADELSKSGVFGRPQKDGTIKPYSKEEIFLVLQQGLELGIKPLQALNNVFPVNGRTAITTALMGALLRQSGQVSWRITRGTEKECVVEMTRGDESQEFSFTWDDATRANLTFKHNWKSYPKQMLYARAFSKAARVMAPDIIGGLYTEEEMQDAVPVDAVVTDPNVPQDEATTTPSTEAKIATVNAGSSAVFLGFKDRIAEAKTDSALRKLQPSVNRAIDTGILTEEQVSELNELSELKLKEIQDGRKKDADSQEESGEDQKPDVGDSTDSEGAGANKES